MAPSAVNFQPWHFIVVTEEEGLMKVRETYNRSWFAEAPVYILACTDHSQSWKRKSDDKDFGDVDIAIAVDHLILKATELGIGTCWVCNFDAGKARDLFCLPEHVEPMVLIPLGYSTAPMPVKKRKDLSEIVHWEKF